MSSTPASSRSGRSKQNRVVILRVSPDKLAVFAPDKRSAKPSIGSKASSTPSTPAAAKDSPAPEPIPDPKDETPNGNADGLEASAGGKGAAAGKPGLKRGVSAVNANDTLPKPRSKPGPKRRKIEAFGAEEAGKPWTQSAPTGGHKLGPKANQGAINAGLRALDRSGRACRKWDKASFSVKSFTGIVWTLPTWGAPKREEPKEEPGEAGTPNSNGEPQEPSSTGNADADTTQLNGAEPNGSVSSPAPVAAAA